MTEPRRGRFWLVSLGAHAVVGAILLASPVGQIVFEHEQPERPEVVRSGQELAEVIEDIRDLTVDRLRAQNALLASAQARMGQNFQTLNAHYQPFAEAQAETARLRFRQQAEETLERQVALLAVAQAATEDPEGRTTALVQALEAHQARIITGQEGIRRSLHLLATEREDLLALHKQIEESQLEAFQFFAWSRDTHHRILRDRRRLPELATSITGLEQAITRLDGVIASGEAARSTAEAEAAAASDQAAKRAAQDAARAAERSIRDSQREKDKQQRQLDRARDEVQKIERQMPEQVASRDNNLRVGRNIQQGVNAQQAAVVEGLSTHLDQTHAAAEPPEDGATP